MERRNSASLLQIMSKYFTLEEATALLPQLKRLLQEMIAARENIIKDRQTWEPIIEKAHTNGGGKHGATLYQESTKIQLTLAKINEWGILIKDLDTGLVDFPHLRDGREVYLCWRMDEPRIDYWHEIDDGFAGRQPL